MEISTLKRPSNCPDPHSAKALRSTLIMQQQSGSPLLMLSLEEENECRLYNPKEDLVYETKGNFSGYRFLASSGKWFLVIDSLANLHIVDVFSDKKISLPSLESMKSKSHEIQRVENNNFKDIVTGHLWIPQEDRTVEDVRGHLWVDEKNEDYVVVWQFVGNYDYLGFCKKGDDHYRDIPTFYNVHASVRRPVDVFLKGYTLYILSKRYFIRILDLSGPDGYQDVPALIRFGVPDSFRELAELEKLKGYKMVSSHHSIAITTSRNILLVHKKIYESTVDRHLIFDLFKRDLKDLMSEACSTDPPLVDSLGDEALFLDLGITVPADLTLGIEPNSIYFTRDRLCPQDHSCLDICVYNLATKKIISFPSLSKFRLKDARWFLPS